MTGTVSFKVYLVTEEEPKQPEIRRFGVDQDVVTNFLYLREKLVSVFPTLRGRHFTISWRDDDEDDILISTDEELNIALQETANDSVRKLYIFVHSEYPKGYQHPSRSAGVYHDGVTCDGCEKSVFGYRYKCLQCLDYDLCASCEAKGIHEDHCMLRLVGPAQWKPHWGRKIAGLMNRSVRRASSAAEKEEEVKCPFSKHGSGRDGHHGKYHGKQHKRHCGSDRPSWANTFATYLNDWANLPGECPMKEKAPETSQNAATEEEPKVKSPKLDNKCPMDSYSELLKMVGENFKPFLPTECPMKEKAPEPAQKVTTDEESKTKSPNVENKCPMDSYAELLKLVGENLTPFLETFVNPLQPKSECEETQPIPSTSRTSDDEDRSAKNSKESSTAGSKTPQQRKASAEAVEINPPVAESAEAPGNEKTSDNEGWTIIGANANSNSLEVDSKKAASVTPSAPPSSIYPALPQIEQTPVVKVKNEIYHPEPKIQQAVETMMQMGFSNEEGWLTNLLVSKNGDIIRALDALQPNRH